MKDRMFSIMSASRTALFIALSGLIILSIDLRTHVYALSPFLFSQSPSSGSAYISANSDATPSLFNPDHSKLGAVASENSICTKIGIDILRADGNAADAMVATVLCVGVIGMQHRYSYPSRKSASCQDADSNSGIGGGGFMLVRASNGSYEVIDFRETAPAAAFEDMYQNNARGSIYTGLASAVPGEIRGLAHLHENHGRLPWKTVVMPAVKVARHGFPVTQDLVRYMRLATQGGENFLVTDPTWALDFAPNGTLVGLGDTMTRRRYADTLETIAERGSNAFYTGPVAETMINALRADNGTMTLEDLQNYTVAIRQPAEITYRGYTIRSCGAPSSGAVALSAMKIIEGYPKIGQAATLNESTHLFDEAIRFAYGQRTELGDPTFVPGTEKREADMLNETTAATIRTKIDPLRTQNVSAYDPSGFESLETHGTSAVVTSDASGLAIALTTTVNLLFGSRLMVPETGIIMNNEMNDFSIPGKSNAFGYVPSPANYIRPGKRPLSSIAPAIVERARDGSLALVTSAAGGSRIITATLQNLWHVLDRNCSIADALARPRFHDQLVPNQVSFEYAFDNATVASMLGRGHNVTWVPPGFSAAQQLRRLENGTFEAAGEPRQLNSAGYVI